MKFQSLVSVFVILSAVLFGDGLNTIYAQSQINEDVYTNSSDETPVMGLYIKYRHPDRSYFLRAIREGKDAGLTGEELKAALLKEAARIDGPLLLFGVMQNSKFEWAPEFHINGSPEFPQRHLVSDVGQSETEDMVTTARLCTQEIVASNYELDPQIPHRPVLVFQIENESGGYTSLEIGYPPTKLTDGVVALNRMLEEMEEVALERKRPQWARIVGMMREEVQDSFVSTHLAPVQMKEVPQEWERTNK